MKEVRLNNGVMMPAIGFGVFQIPASETEKVASDALEVGYRMIDTASSYFNEEQVGNAIRHSGSGKYLGLCLNTSEKSVKIQIEDHGKGMSPQQQKQIFTRNYTTAGKSFGSGLGLAIAKSLARQIGGEIQVYSIPDKKTVFSVILKS